MLYYLPSQAAEVTVVGYGATNPDGSGSSPQLLETTSYVVTYDLCYNFYFDTLVDETQICMGGAEGQDICDGDRYVVLRLDLLGICCSTDGLLTILFRHHHSVEDPCSWATCK